MKNVCVSEWVVKGVCLDHLGSMGVGVGEQIRRSLLHQPGLLTRAQVLYTNFDFPTFSGVDSLLDSKMGYPRIQKLLGFGICGSAIFWAWRKQVPLSATHDGGLKVLVPSPSDEVALAEGHRAVLGLDASRITPTGFFGQI